MKMIRLFAVLAMFVGNLAFAISIATPFSGSDNFSTDAGNWGSITSVTNSGNLVINSGVMSFTDNGLAGSTSSSVRRNWTLNYGTTTADWQVQIDFTLGLAPVAGEFTSLALVIVNNSNSSNDYATLTFQRTYLGSSVSGVFTTGGTSGTTTTVNPSGYTQTVMANYVATSGVLSLYYLNGSSYSLITSQTISGWNMTSSDYFGLAVVGNNVANGGATTAIAEGQIYADNFSTSATAIPEPATCVVVLGFSALGLALWRRKGR